MTTDSKKITRRHVLLGAAGIAGGATIGISGSSLLSGAEAAPACQLPAMPWPYKKLDVEYVRKLGHLGYYKSNCSLYLLCDLQSTEPKSGYPYTAFPYEPVGQIDGLGGGGGFFGSDVRRSNWITDGDQHVSKDYKTIGNELIGWYTETPFPSEISNGYASRHSSFMRNFLLNLKGNIIPTKYCRRAYPDHLSVTSPSVSGVMRLA